VCQVSSPRIYLPVLCPGQIQALLSQALRWLLCASTSSWLQSSCSLQPLEPLSLTLPLSLSLTHTHTHTHPHPHTAQCCHPTSCISSDSADAPNCSNMMCDMSCQTPLDCDAECTMTDAGTCQVTQTVSDPVVGGDLDDNGCIGSAGFTWCAATSECVQKFYTPCPELPVTEQEVPLATEVAPPLTDEACWAVSTGCDDCLAGGCGWAGSCMPNCGMIADVACYDGQYAGCADAASDAADSKACYTDDANKGCGECTSIVMPSGSNCMWFEEFGFCGHECGMIGCGSTTCDGEETLTPTSPDTSTGTPCSGCCPEGAACFAPDPACCACTGKSCGEKCDVEGSMGGVCDKEGGCIAVGAEEIDCPGDTGDAECAGKGCGEMCVVGGDMAGICDTSGACSFEYEKVEKDCAARECVMESCCHAKVCVMSLPRECDFVACTEIWMQDDVTECGYDEEQGLCFGVDGAGEKVYEDVPSPPDMDDVMYIEEPINFGGSDTDCEGMECGDPCIVEGDMARLCNKEGACSFDYEGVMEECDIAVDAGECVWESCCHAKACTKEKSEDKILECAKMMCTEEVSRERERIQGVSANTESANTESANTARMRFVREAQ